MIVRISGHGQYELDDNAAHRLQQLDVELTAAVHAGNSDDFHRLLHQTVEFVCSGGTPVPHDQVKPSDVIIPPEDVTVEEAKRFFDDDTLLEPLPA